MALKYYSTCKYLLNYADISSYSLKILNKQVPINTHQLLLSRYVSSCKYDI